jgi:hypothetical protein
MLAGILLLNGDITDRAYFLWCQNNRFSFDVGTFQHLLNLIKGLAHSQKYFIENEHGR